MTQVNSITSRFAAVLLCAWVNCTAGQAVFAKDSLSLAEGVPSLIEEAATGSTSGTTPVSCGSSQAGRGFSGMCCWLMDGL